MDRLEAKHDELAEDVTSLKGTVARVETNQMHAAELNKLRFDSLEASMTALGGKFDAFTHRIELVFSGEVVLPQQRAGQELLAEWQVWRKSVEDRMNDPLSHPATRVLAEKIAAEADARKTAADKLEAVAIESAKNRQWIAMVGAVLGVVVVVANFVAPIVIKLLP